MFRPICLEGIFMDVESCRYVWTKVGAVAAEISASCVEARPVVIHDEDEQVGNNDILIMIIIQRAKKGKSIALAPRCSGPSEVTVLLDEARDRNALFVMNSPPSI